jgi:hypothetical protein
VRTELGAKVPTEGDATAGSATTVWLNGGEAAPVQGHTPILYMIHQILQEIFSIHRNNNKVVFILVLYGKRRKISS